MYYLPSKTSHIFTRQKKHYHCTHYIIYPFTKASRCWKKTISPPLTRRISQQTKQHYNDGKYPSIQLLTEMKKHPDYPTCPILWEYHQMSPQIEHLHNLWIQPFPPPTDSNLPLEGSLATMPINIEKSCCNCYHLWGCQRMHQFKNRVSHLTSASGSINWLTQLWTWKKMSNQRGKCSLVKWISIAVFATESLDRIYNVGVRLRQHCNAGATTMGKWGIGEG